MQKLKPWSHKSSALMWHGISRDRNVNATHSHQDLFIVTLDVVAVREMEMKPEMIADRANLAYAAYKQYRETTTNRGDIATWLGHVASVVLRGPPCKGSDCERGQRIYKNMYHPAMGQQLRYKLLADIDGDSSTSRFHYILRSKSAPVKATIYTEWHDSRLIPWLH